MQVLIPERVYGREHPWQGHISEQIPALVANDSIPGTAAQIMWLRNKVLEPGHSNTLRRTLWDTNIDTRTAAMLFEDGSLSIATTPAIYVEMIPALSGNQYFFADEATMAEKMALGGVHFTPEQVKKHAPGFFGGVYEPKAVLDNLIWAALAEGNTSLLWQYAANAFDVSRRRFPFDPTTPTMGVYAPEPPENGARCSIVSHSNFSHDRVWQGYGAYLIGWPGSVGTLIGFPKEIKPADLQQRVTFSLN